MSPQPAPDTLKTVGRALVTSGVVFVVMAVLIYIGALPVEASARRVIAAGVGTVAVLDGLIGWWFLSRSR